MNVVDGFELDRASSGRIKVNAVSVANLVALMGVLIAAIGSWTGITSQVSLLSLRTDNLEKTVAHIRTELGASLATKDNDLRELRSRIETVSTRLSIVETQLNVTGNAINRIENKVDAIQEKVKVKGQ